MSKPTRSQRRKDFDEPIRIALLEDDMDVLEGTFDEVREGNKRIQHILWGVLSSLLVAVILLALNLAIGKLPLPGA